MSVDYITTVWKQIGDDRQLQTFSRMASGANHVEDRLETLKSSAANIMTGAGAAVAAGFGHSLKKGMDAIEADNLVNVTFGEDNMPEITTWSQKLRKELSLNEYALRRDAGTFGSLFKGIGKSGDELTGMSEKVTMLSRDLASFGNTSNEDAMRALHSALVGENEPIKRYNVLINEALTQTYAYTHGIAKQGAELTEQQKILARYGLILEQTKDSQGDLTRTKDSPANLARAALEEMGNIETDYGKTQQRLMQTVLRGAHSVLPVVEGMAEGFSKLPEWMQLGTLGIVGGVGPLMKLTGFIHEMKNASNLATIAKKGLTAATKADDAAEAAKALTAGKEATAIGEAGEAAADATGKVDKLGKVTKFFSASAFGLEGAAALGVGAAAVGITALAINDIMNSAKDMHLSDEDYAKKRGLRGQIELDAARGASDNSLAKWWRGDAAAEEASRQAQEIDKAHREKYKRMGIRPQDVDSGGYSGGPVRVVQNPEAPAVTARAARSRNARASVNVAVDVPYGPGDYDADDRNATSLYGA